MNANVDLLSHIDGAEVVQLTQKLIAIPSPVWGETQVAKWITDWFAERGFSTEFQKISLSGGGVTHQVIGKLKGNGTGPSLMLCGHTDTSMSKTGSCTGSARST
jgi:acetylornithine deacetylase/succinyl-diaminopimelate desuccinylase-like protein